MIDKENIKIGSKIFRPTRPSANKGTIWEIIDIKNTQLKIKDQTSKIKKIILIEEEALKFWDLIK